MLSLSEASEAVVTSDKEGDGRCEMSSTAKRTPQQDCIEDPLVFGAPSHSRSTLVVPKFLKEDLLCFEDLPVVQPTGDRVPELRDQQDLPDAVAIQTNAVQNNLCVPEADLLGLNLASQGSSFLPSGSSLACTSPGTCSGESVSPSLRSRILRSPKRTRRPVLQKPESGPIPRLGDVGDGRFIKINQKKKDGCSTIPFTPLSPLGPGDICQLSQRDVLARHSLAQRAHEFTSNTDLSDSVMENQGKVPAAKAKAKTAAERTRLFRARQRERLSVKQVEKQKEKERKRLAEHRQHQKVTVEGRAKLAQQQKNWKKTWKSGLSRQKIQALNTKAKNEMRTLRSDRTEKSINLSTAMHNIWKKKQIPVTSTSSKPCPRTMRREASRLLSTVQHFAYSPNSRAMIVHDALNHCSPATKAALTDQGIITDKGSAEVLANINQSAKQLRGDHTNNAFGARRALLTAFRSSTSSKKRIAKATGFDRRAVAAAVLSSDSQGDALYSLGTTYT